MTMRRVTVTGHEALVRAMYEIIHDVERAMDAERRGPKPDSTTARPCASTLRHPSAKPLQEFLRRRKLK
jgi:hypothetical protein